MAGQVNNALYVRRRGRILVPEAHSGAPAPLPLVASLSRNLESLGYALTAEALEACRAIPEPELVELYDGLVADLQSLVGAHRRHRPMYPNFPAQVMEMWEGELYLHALLHYWTGGKYLPETKVDPRLPLFDPGQLRLLGLGTREEFEGLFAAVAGGNTAVSEQDREDLEWFVRAYGDDIAPLLPAAVPQKENMAYLAALLLAHTSHAAEFVGRFVRTATDVLRLAAAMSDGDVSLAVHCKFRSFSRAERRMLLELLERQPNLAEDMRRWEGRWLRLGERLHPGESAARSPRSVEAFKAIRSGSVRTFNTGVEAALSARDRDAALSALVARPGDLARRLDHLLRLQPEDAAAVVSAFAERAGRVSTPVLLQVMQHFAGRRAGRPLRVFFPKGNVARANAIENKLPELSEAVCASVVEACEQALRERFGVLEPLGRVYIEPDLAAYTIPFATRSASRALRTPGRGSRLPLPDDCTTLRFFLWWKNGKSRTDIDLSAALFDESFGYRDIVSYYNLKTYGGHHSGDIVDAPEGASEFIDLTVDTLRESGLRYVALVCTSFTRQPYHELPECFTGWMAREYPNSGEIYEPKAVVDRLDLTADSQIAIPVLFDLVEKRAIWCDLSLRAHPAWQNHVDANLKGVQLTLRSLLDLNKPNLFDLFRLHAESRGTLVERPEDADRVFSVGAGTPFRGEEIAADYLR